MLSTIKRYVQGYSCIPVIIACRKAGLFTVLNDTTPVPFADLVKRLQANGSYLLVALKILESLGWLLRNDNGDYLLTSQADMQAAVPPDIMNVISFPIEDYLYDHQGNHSLNTWIQMSHHHWKVSNPLIADFLDGMILIPLALGLTKETPPGDLQNWDLLPLSGLASAAENEIKSLLIAKGWVQKVEPHALSVKGRFMIKTISASSALASYRPMLLNLHQVIFGHGPSAVNRIRFDRFIFDDRCLSAVDGEDYDTNVLPDLEKTILSLFNQEEVAEQPRYVVDIGCGNGSFLKKIYDVIKNRSLRGKRLHDHPVTLIGVVADQEALEEATSCLKGLDHAIVKGTIENPRKLMDALRSMGICDMESILQVHAFQDRSQSYRKPLASTGVSLRSKHSPDADYVDEAGNSLPVDLVIQDLVNHFKRRSAVIGRHGLIIVEAHRLQTKTIRRYWEDYGNLLLDTCLEFSHLHPVKPDQFLLAAAKAGLFPGSSFNKYPTSLPFCQSTLIHFEKRDYGIRMAEKADLPALERLEEQCWSQPLRSSASVLQRRLMHYPQGQLVLEMDERVVGVIYAQRIENQADLSTATMDTVETLQQENGSVLQLLAINIDPQAQQRQLGDQLLEFMLQYGALIPGITSVVAITLCRDFHRQTELSMASYVGHRDEWGHLSDPILRFHELHGATIAEIIKGYRPGDTNNKGYGVLVHYDIHRRQRREVVIDGRLSAKANRAETNTAKTGSYQKDVSLPLSNRENQTESIDLFLENGIKKLLGKDRENRFSKESPLLEMGLDSADLMKLSELMSFKFQKKLMPSFFFRHNTHQRIVTYLETRETTNQKVISSSHQTAANQVRSVTNPDTGNRSSHRSIAIIGMACRLPGAVDTPEELWQVLTSGRSVIGQLPEDRWQWPPEIDPQRDHAGIDRGGYLQEIDRFDASLFRLVPKEVELMDPQQRILLELTWEALEHSGYCRDSLAGSQTGVYVGSSGSDYHLLLAQKKIEAQAYTGTGNAMAILANRISYFFDFCGPSIQLDTACSSSLVAVHQACQALQAGTCEQALVGGINLICHPENAIIYHKAGMLSKDGLCKPFDQNANGYVRSEGAVMLMLKPLHQALADQDVIHALIKGTACNHVGQASGLTAPVPEQQARLIQDAWKRSEVSPDRIGYLETHGTGTLLGDPIEIDGLKQAFSEFPGQIRQQPSCALGSVKSNLGHLEAAAGIAGLLKVVLCLKHQELVPSIHFRTLNPQIDLANSPFYINRSHVAWPDQATDSSANQRNMAGVSSFGSGGSNAHAILEAFPVDPPVASDTKPPYLFVLSAKNRDRLSAYVQRLISFLQVNDNLAKPISLASFVYSLQRRQALEERISFPVSSLSELKKKLTRLLREPSASDICQGNIHDTERNSGLTGTKAEVDAQLQTWSAEGRLQSIAEFWVNGGTVNDWDVLYQRIPAKIDLPAYPFSHERYWFAEKTSEAHAHAPACQLTEPELPAARPRHLPKPSGIRLSDPSSPYFMTQANQEKQTRHNVRPNTQQPGNTLENLKSALPGRAKDTVPTLNRTGVMLEKLTPCSEAFASDAGKSKGEVLDVGCAYGVATIEALERGARVVALDMESKHLDILGSRVSQDAKQRLTLQQGQLPGVEFKENRFAAIHASRVIHFLEPGDVRQTIQKMFKWLQPGGRLYLITDTPYVGLWETQTADYVSRKAAGDLWPGYEANFRRFFREDDDAPPVLNPLDPDVLSRECRAAGFIVEKAGFEGIGINLGGNPPSQAGKEHAALIGQKPAAGNLSTTKSVVVSKTDYVPELSKTGGPSAIEDHCLKQEEMLAAIKARLRKGLIDELNIDAETLDETTPFKQLGVNSVVGVLWISKLNEYYHLKIPATRIYDYPTVSEFAVFLKQELRKQNLLQPNRPVPPDASDTRNHPSSPVLHSAMGYERDGEATRSGKNNTAPAPDNTETAAATGIAIIGMSGQFPKSKTLDQFWENLAQGKDCISEIPSSRWSLDRYYDPDPEVPGKTSCKWLGILEDADRFDPIFFSISPTEAALMDPQQRLFLEHAWSCIENAGLNPVSLSGTECGVFVGCQANDYGQLINERSLNAQSLLGGSPAILAGRISYLLNLKGPSLSIDTACSSSLVAIIEACNHLINKKSDLAIAGGVNVLPGPSLHIMGTKAGVYSRQGRCFTFDHRADGFVPGEGVGVVLLKRLSEAVHDEDQIQGVIKGWGLNQDGKTNGITAPSVKSQVALEKEIYERFRINPETISLVEAHGTGTTLGDPIEVEALTESFGAFTNKTNFCALGSAKSNIGHLMHASGIAGVIKVLLSIRQQLLPPTIHFEQLNHHIALKNSPFFVNTELQPWKTSHDVPRRATVSSFGFSGTNAHLVIEEYNPPDPQPLKETHDTASSEITIVLLSAKNKDRLRAYADQLLRFIERHDGQQHDFNLANLAYTLQVGREAMEVRLGLIVRSLQDLKEKLSIVINGKTTDKGIYQGQIKHNRETLSAITGDEDMAKTVEAWIRKGKYGKLLDLWVKGLFVDWHQLSGPKRLRRISVPAYPFARERYWIKGSDSLMPVQTDQGTGHLHPLVHHNTSDFSQQSFSSTFTGEEFFLNDHRVKGKKILPGVAHLELAQEAIKQSWGQPFLKNQVIQLANIVWMRPIAIDSKPEVVRIGLQPKANGEIAYEIHAGHSTRKDTPVVYSQGTAKVKSTEPSPPVEIDELRSRFNQKRLNPQVCYDTFKSRGLDLGPAFRGLEEVLIGENDVLAKLTLPDAVADSGALFTLHPSLLDSAQQASIGINFSGTNHTADTQLFVPFALESLEIKHPCTASMWAWVRRVQRTTAARDMATPIQTLDIDICDEMGTICVAMKGVATRALEEEGSERSNLARTLLVKPVWKEKQALLHEKLQTGTDHRVFLCGFDRDLQAVQDTLAPVVVSDLEGDRSSINQASLAQRYEAASLNLLKAIHQTITGSPENPVLFQVLVPDQGPEHVFSALSGLLKTAHLEYPGLFGQIIAVNTALSDGEIAARLLENRDFPEDQQIRYAGDQRLVASYRELPPAKSTKTMPWREGGVYLITGGVGGLGFIFAKEIVKKVKHATLILTGRSKSDRAKIETLEESGSIGVQVVYQPADVCDQKAVDTLIKEIRAEYGNLRGIIHAAGIIKDNFILKKSPAEFKHVLWPKVNGVMNLDLATKDLDLDFFVLFSAGAGAIGNIGQADYASANAFLDVFAKVRNALLGARERSGRTLSINWPFWKDGGMKADDATRQMLEERTGMTPMESDSGLEAFYHSLDTDESQVLVLHGPLQRLKQKLLASTPGKSQPKPAPAKVASEIDTSRLYDTIQQTITQSISTLLQVKTEILEVDAELNQYGFDSLLLTDFTNSLNKKYQLGLAPTIFFEYPTIASFSRYLAEEHQQVFASRFQIQTQTRQLTETDPLPTEKELASSIRNTRFTQPTNVSEDESSTSEPIAIVGISGTFPMARDIEQFCKNLRDARDCIKEIPKERWDWREFFGDPQQETNKTNIKWGGFIDGVGEFDPLFFGISPREAEFMDPHHRLLMTHVWLALEDAGYSAASLAGSNTGIFIGTGSSGYNSLVASANLGIESYSSTGMVPSVGPNRMSYFLNIHGPSEPIETACSSSLVAIHRAILGMETGGCDQAIVGGVNTIVSPEFHISFNKAGMLCQDGRCKTFSKQANGYVRGEGVGMLFLKKLKKAEATGDHIYGLIRSSAENHGGRASSLTAPNPKAQSELLIRAYKKAGIDPGTISYIEAHGTGTELGDPIEVNALKSAFKTLYQETGRQNIANAHCGLGSVKTNIGHLEFAAGVAGVIKVLLQFRDKRLYKSLHCDELNPYIDLKGSPFFIVQNAQEWNPLKDAHGNIVPRRAGVSSFGFGGVNAHVVLEEYIAPKAEKPGEDLSATPSDFVMVPLSARDKERLLESAKRLLRFLEQKDHSGGTVKLHDLAYTLQVGREVMEERLLLNVRSLDDLRQTLRDFTEGRQDVRDLYRGQVKRHREALKAFHLDDDMAGTVDAWIRKGKTGRLSELWVQGLVFDWQKLYANNQPRRVSLPTYPFARERYWAGTPSLETSGTSRAVVHKHRHPLVQENRSTLVRQTFHSTFSGDEFFLTDHRIKERNVLPGVAYLEMAQAAIGQAMEDNCSNNFNLRLSNVVWANPFDDVSQALHINLLPKENGEIAYEIITDQATSQADPLIYSQGSASLISAPPVQPSDLNALRSSFKRPSLEAPFCYECFTTMGLEYGPAHQGLKRLFQGDDQVLAQLALPPSLADTLDQFTLHPSLMDAALQAAIGLRINENGSMDKTPLLPYALDSLEVLSPCTASMWAWVRRSHDSRGADAARKLDIDLYDHLGNICVSMRGLTSRPLMATSPPRSEPHDILLIQPLWQEKAVDSQTPLVTEMDHRVFLGDLDFDLTRLQEKAPHISFSDLEPYEYSPETALRYTEVSRYLFAVVRQVLKEKPRKPVVLQVLVPDQTPPHPFTGLAGLLKTARLENPNLWGQLIAVPADTSPDHLIANLLENNRSPRDHHIRYRAEKRLVASLAEATELKVTAALPWQEKGVYLITGGAGGLGLIFAREIAQALRHVRLVLTGRSLLGPEKQADIESLEALGAKVTYHQSDVTDFKATNQLIREIQTRFGRLNGILHAAGVINDAFIIHKTATDFTNVLAPKVTGTVNLDLATKALALDFYVLFSSGSGVLGNVGQADYATANAFMDSFARLRNALRERGQRRGQTLSINWPLWQEGGMAMDEASAQVLNAQTGLAAMETTAGFEAFYRSLHSRHSQVLVLAGELEKVAGLLGPEKTSGAHSLDQAPEATSVQEAEHPAGKELLQEKTISFLKQQIANVVKIPVRKIQAEAHLESYGIDSMMVTRLTGELEKYFGSLSKTLFFEYQTLEDLSRYFLEFHHATLMQRLLPNNRPTAAADTSQTPPPETVLPIVSRHHRFNAAVQPSSIPGTPLDIAIIGLAGRYPGSPDPEAFWQNLRDGKDCICEIPKERWNWEDYYTPDRTQSGRHYSKWGGFIDEADCFDPHFFNISPREAMLIDPQERLFLEHAWMALEDAGYQRSSLENRTENPLQEVGVYAGVMWTDYPLFGAEESLRGNPTALSGSHASIANRVSYLLNLHGPSLTVDTMCSSSLTALHLACQDLKQGRTQLAIAGGVNVSLHPNKYLGLSMNQFISSQGQCESFGEGGDGYIPGEGVGVVLLKRLAEARQDRDHIYGIIKGSAINHGGKTNGYSVPNPRAQTAAVKRALEEAAVDPKAISYIEAHGTGTKLGDPIEIAGLSKAFGPVSQKQFCRIGSAKSNIGHCESAAGIAAVTKVLLQLQHGQIAPSLHAEVLNPNIDFSQTPFVVNRELRDWKPPIINGKTYPRLAGISCFGAGGSNAHLVIEEYIPEPSATEPPAVSSSTDVMLVLSARDRNRVKTYAENLLQFIRSRETSHRQVDLSDLAYTLQVGREAMEERLGLIVSSLETLKEKLQTVIDEREDIEDVYRGQVKPNKETLGVFAADEDMAETIAAWIRKRKYGKLLELWVKGLTVDWHQLYDKHKPRRISAPVYPFARNRYHAGSLISKTVDPSRSGTTNHLHPSVRETTSNVAQQRLGSLIPEVESSPDRSRTKEKKHFEWQFTLPGSGDVSDRRFSKFSPEEKAKLLLRQLVAKQLQKPANDVEPDGEFFDMGLTSAGIANMTGLMKKKIGSDFLPSLFFEYTTISDLSSYLAKNHADALKQLIVTKKESVKNMAEPEIENQPNALVSQTVSQAVKQSPKPDLNKDLPQNPEQPNHHVLKTLKALEKGLLDIDEATALIQ